MTRSIADEVAALEGRQALSQEALGHLNSLWNSIWAEVYYDPANESSQRFAQYLLPHIEALNKELKFKR